MVGVDPNDSLLDDPGRDLTKSFELLSNDTRLSILLALWEADEPGFTETAVSFSELYDRVDVRDSGNFTYHLDKLTGHFVVETDDGYSLSAAGEKIVRAVVAGTGSDAGTLAPTDIDTACYRCGETRVELQYRDGAVHLTCNECAGAFDSEELPTGTISVREFDRAGLAGRTLEELRAASGIKNRHGFRMMQEGVCPTCSGTIEVSLQLCENHVPDPGQVCPNCETNDSARVRYTCTVCKNWDSIPAELTVTTHPEVISFYYERGVDTRLKGGDPERHTRVVSHYWEMSHTLVSSDPVRIRITVPCEGDELRLTLDGELDVVDGTETSG